MCNEAITVEIVEEASKNLKCGTAVGMDGLTLEHIIYSHPVLIIHLKQLFNIFLLHGLVPDSFGYGIIIPLLKDIDGNKTLSNNYCGITLSCVICKLFESVLMFMFTEYLSTDWLQFGFKRNTSCSHAIFTLRTVVNHYVKSGVRQGGLLSPALFAIYMDVLVDRLH